MNDMTQNLPAQMPATIEQRPVARERIIVQDPIAVLDTARFEQMQRVAVVMARCSLIPEALYMKDRNPLPDPVVIANCFLVVNQAVRWGMDPFSVAQCVSVVKGKLCYEGKLIASVLDARLGIKLEYDLVGEGDHMRVTVRGVKDGRVIVDSNNKPKVVTGSVAEWRTTHSGSPWSAPGGAARMLCYRGAREWYRRHEPSIMLGVYSDEEMDDLSENMRAERARPVQMREEMPPQSARLPPPQQAVPQETVPLQPMEEMPPEPQQAGPAEEMPPQPQDRPKPVSDHQWLVDVDAACAAITNDPTKLFSDLAAYQTEHIVSQRDKRPPDIYTKAMRNVNRWVQEMMNRQREETTKQAPQQ
jgi:hypothetical protein